MTRQKLKRFAEIEKMENVFRKPENMAGKWSGHFGDGEIVLEIGCGAGDYSLNLAEKYPKKNFVGLDRKGDRIWRGAKKAKEAGVGNVAFIQGFAEELEKYFGPNELSEVWITFPDPYPKPSRARRRLPSVRFLEIYKKVLAPKGVVHLKTDDLDLFEFGLESIKEAGFEIEEEVRDIWGQKTVPELLQITTYYESKFKKEGRKICYVRGRLNNI